MLGTTRAAVSTRCLAFLPASLISSGGEYDGGDGERQGRILLSRMTAISASSRLKSTVSRLPSWSWLCWGVLISLVISLLDVDVEADADINDRLAE